MYTSAIEDASPHVAVHADIRNSTVLKETAYSTGMTVSPAMHHWVMNS